MISHLKLLRILALAPIVFLFLDVWTTVYPQGYYIEVTGNTVITLPLDKGKILLEGSGPLPDGYEVKITKNTMVITGPLPEGAVVHIAWTPWYSFARQVNIVTNDILENFVNPKLFMKDLQTFAYFGSILITIFEFLFNLQSKKQNKPTIISVYKIYLINIKVQTATFLRIFN